MNRLHALLPVALLTLIGLSSAHADGFGDSRFWGEGFGMGHMFFGGAMMIAFWGAIILLVVLGIRWISGSGSRSQDDVSSRSSSLRILEERYARGDIDHDEFERRRQTLLQSGGPV